MIIPPGSALGLLVSQVEYNTTKLNARSRQCERLSFTVLYLAQNGVTVLKRPEAELSSTGPHSKGKTIVQIRVRSDEGSSAETIGQDSTNSP